LGFAIFALSVRGTVSDEGQPSSHW